MRIHDLAGKNICILGYGKEGKAMVAALEEYAAGCRITIADKSADVQSDKYDVRSGEHYDDNLGDYDVIIKSPGIPLNAKLSAQSAKLTSSTQIFLDSISDTGATVIGVTGSKGKSTTSTLIHEILKAAGRDSYLIGNIGEASISHIKDARSNTFFVLEMSSYQLMDLTVSPEIAVVTSFFPEHLDYHSTRPLEAGSLMASHGKDFSPLENYLEAKKRIARFQTKSDVIIFNAQYPACCEIAEESVGEKIPFRAKDAPVRQDDILLQGEHNLGNIAAAWKVCEVLKIPKDSALATIRAFRGLPHRLESLGVHSGIEWVNDSISTTPESAAAALSALGSRVRVIILGGQDRGYDFTPLAQKIRESSSLRTVVLLPDSGRVIGKAIEHIGAPVILASAETLGEAVGKARLAARDPKPENAEIPIVLLSPAAPSYGHFKNFEDRGDQFRALVDQI